MRGEHGYRRADAGKALAKGLGGKIPTGWKPIEENAYLEIWLTIQGATAVCGVRLSDRTMRHRRYQDEHQPAALRPSVAAAMVRLLELRPGHVLLDPMCGTGTLLAEALETSRQYRTGPIDVLGGDIDPSTLVSAAANLRRVVHEPRLARWDAGRLPLPDASVDRLASNPPFGKQLSSPEEVGPLYRRVLPEYNRVLKAGGRAVLIVSDLAALKEAVRACGWRLERQLRVRILGHPAFVTLWSKPQLQPLASGG
jgi:23S rRNA G2445 N2-methylase RlmL